MGSRRSSDSSFDDQSRGSISMEYDDYPLDLVSPIALDSDFMEPAFELPPPTIPSIANWTPPPVVMRPKKVYEKDRLITENDMITDFGRRSYCDYDTENNCPNGDVFITKRAQAASLNLLKTKEAAAAAAAERNLNKLPDVAEEEKHYEKQQCCDCCGRLCLSACRPCLVKYHPLSDDPSCWERLRYAFLLPPHGAIANSVTLALCAALVWGTLWALVGQDALPGGNFFALMALVVAGYILGAIVKIVKLPPLLGMLIAGCLLRNLPSVNIGKDINNDWSTALRSMALVVILLRAGLGLDPRALKKLSFTVVRLAFLPCIFETAAVGVAAHYLLDFPWILGFMLGFVLSAVTPAVVVPSMLSLTERGYGTEQGIPTLVIAAASIDDVLAITGFTVLLGVFFTQGELVLTIFRGPLEALAGVVYGLVLGVLFWFLPENKNRDVSLFRFTLLLCAGMFATFGSQAAGCPGAGALGCLVVAFVAALRWRDKGWDHDTNPVEDAMGKLWMLLEPLLFGLIGAEIDITKLSPSVIGLGVAVIFIGSGVRMVISFLAVCGSGLRLREKFFIPFAWLPKATVQAAVGSVTLDTARAQGASDPVFAQAMQIVAIAVLVILIMAPLGAALIAFTGPRLLRNAKDRHLAGGDGEKMDLTWDDQLEYSSELSKMNVNVDEHGRMDITTERETVT